MFNIPESKTPLPGQDYSLLPEMVQQQGRYINDLKEMFTAKINAKRVPKDTRFSFYKGGQLFKFRMYLL